MTVMSDGTAPTLRVTPAARAAVLEARDAEANPDRLALFVEVSGAAAGSYRYDMWFEAAADAGPGDAVDEEGGLTTVVVSASVDALRGATLDVAESGLVLLNPNTPPEEHHHDHHEHAEPEMDFGDLSSPLAAAVQEVLDNEVNPQIAMHGGRADLVGVDAEGVAYLRLSGGCQGCGLAAVTLSQGISVAIEQSVPEITRIVDVTQHAAGNNPYYQPAKK